MESSTANVDATQNIDASQNIDVSSVPFPPDFSTLRSAAATYRMFGGTPVPLFNDPESGEEGEEGEAGETDSPEPDLFRGPEWVYDPKISAQEFRGLQLEDEANWQKADGIGLITGIGGWHGFLVDPLDLSASSIPPFRVQDSAWIAKNDEYALIYFRTDARISILRALASIIRTSEHWTIGSDVDAFSGPYGPRVLLPAPPSQDLIGGPWEFSKDMGLFEDKSQAPEDKPQAPPPYREFEVRATIHWE